MKNPNNEQLFFWKYNIKKQIMVKLKKSNKNVLFYIKKQLKRLQSFRKKTYQSITKNKS